MDAYTFALLNVAGLALVLLAQRRVVFSWSAIGAFLITNVLIVQVGLLGIALFRDFAELTFSVFNLELVTDADLELAIVLNVWGAGIVLAAYHLTHIALSGGRVLRRAPNLLALDFQGGLGFARDRLLLGGGIVLVAALAYAAVSAPRLVLGLEGVLAGSEASILGARYDIGGDYLFILMVLNVLPFLGVALRVVQRLQGGGSGLSLFVAVFNACTAVLLLLTFQKRPLVVFLGCLFLANIVIDPHRLAPLTPNRSDSIWRRIRHHRLVRLAAYGLVGFVILIVLYQLQTQAVVGAEDLTDLARGIGTLAAMAITTIVGGQAVPALLFAHYFPAIEPHYGLSNIGLLSRLSGSELYRPTYAVYDYFVGVNPFIPFVDRIEGSVASAALVDFYGGFGLVGWVFGALALGIALNRIDAAMVRLRPDASRGLLAIFLFVSIYYLSNASVANTLAGYGGLIFLMLWWLLRVPYRALAVRAA